MASYLENKQFAEEIFPCYPLDDAIEWIKSYLLPEDVFDPKQLKDWAEGNGYVKED